MWTVHAPTGGNWYDCNLPPMEDDDYYGTALAATAVGHAPGDYKSTDAAKIGIEKSAATSAPARPQSSPPGAIAVGLHGNRRADGHQRARKNGRRPAGKAAPDGGWSLTSLGRFSAATAGSTRKRSRRRLRHRVRVYVLRQSGMPADAEPIRRGIGWLKTHQRASGRWYTRSPTLDTTTYNPRGHRLCVDGPVGLW